MIRIDLLSSDDGQDGEAPRAFSGGRRATAIWCGAILAGTALWIGWCTHTIGEESNRLDRELSAAHREAAGLRAVTIDVQRLEQRKVQLHESVALVEQLRQQQAGPVRMLDQISLAMPPMLWLTELKETPAKPGEILMTGKCESLRDLTDFIRNLESSGHVTRSIEISSSHVESPSSARDGLVVFGIRAQFEGSEASRMPTGHGAERQGRG